MGGNFLALMNEPGYVRLVSDKSVKRLLKQIRIVFAQVSPGPCSPLGGFYEIHDEITCKASGVALGIDLNEVHFFPRLGCGAYGKRALNRQARLCCTEGCKPFPTTTTTTTTTTSTTLTVTSTTLTVTSTTSSTKTTSTTSTLSTTTTSS